MPSVSNFQTALEGVLVTQITAAATTATVKVKEINGVVPTWLTTAHRVTIIQKSRTVTKVEVVDVAAGTTQSGSTVTLGTLTRGLPLDGTGFTGTGTPQVFTSGAKVIITWDAQAGRQTMFKDIDNTLATGKKIFLGDSGNYITGTAAGDITLASNTTAAKTLAQLAAAAGTDEKAAVSANDTTPDYLVNKITGGDGITVTETDDAGDETLDIDVDLATDPGLEISSSQLRVKVKSAGGITRDSDGLSVDNTFTKIARFFGDGSDGAKAIAASENLDPTDDFNYTTFQLDSGQTLSVSSVNTPLIIRCTGNATINGTIDLNGKGGAASAGGSIAGNSSAATAGNSLVSGITNGAGGAATTTNGGRGGGGGASSFNVGTAGANSGGSAGTSLSTINAIWLANLNLFAVCGGGGSGGSGDDATDAGAAGGAGGGVLIMYIAGNLTLGASSVIRANGANGSNAGATAGSGGGGGGGTVFVVVGGTITNGGVTVSATGGTGGSTSNAGGNGGAGKVLIYSLADNTVISA